MNTNHNIICGVHYNSIPSYTAYKALTIEWGGYEKFKNANNWGNSTISLSLSASVSDTDAERIVEATKIELSLM